MVISSVLLHACIAMLLFSTPATPSVLVEPCHQEVLENTANFTLHCSRLDPRFVCFWSYESLHGGHRADLGSCRPSPDPCHSSLPAHAVLSRPAVDRCTLTIRNITWRLYLKSIITCTAFYESKLRGSDSCRIHVVYPPEVSLEVQGKQGSMTMNESASDVLFQCRVNASSPVNVTLLKDGRELERAGDQRSATVKVKHAMPATCDSTANYSCYAVNDYGQRAVTLPLQVICAPALTNEPFSGLLPVLREPANVTINITAYPPPHSLTFVRDADLVHDLFQVDCTSTSPARHICVISLVTVITEDTEGVYRLDIVNERGQLGFNFWVEADLSAQRGIADEENVKIIIPSVIAGITVPALIIVVIVIIVKKRRRRANRLSREDQQQDQAAHPKSQPEGQRHDPADQRPQPGGQSLAMTYEDISPTGSNLTQSGDQPVTASQPAGLSIIQPQAVDTGTSQSGEGSSTSLTGSIHLPVNNPSTTYNTGEGSRTLLTGSIHLPVNNPSTTYKTGEGSRTSLTGSIHLPVHNPSTTYKTGEGSRTSLTGSIHLPVNNPSTTYNTESEQSLDSNTDLKRLIKTPAELRSEVARASRGMDNPAFLSEDIDLQDSNSSSVSGEPGSQEVRTTSHSSSQSHC